MEQANKQIEAYLIQMKSNMKDKLTELNLISQGLENEQLREFIEYMWEYPKYSFSKQDSNLFVKKQEKNKTDGLNTPISPEDLCVAKRTDGVQCTRKKKKGCDYCGTHAKIEKKVQSHATANLQKMEVAAEDINGIIYYIDDNLNVYHTEDILENKPNPRIIAKAVKNNNIITIPELY